MSEVRTLSSEEVAALKSVSPFTGRYQWVSVALEEYFGEGVGLQRHRLRVMVSWLRYILSHPSIFIDSSILERYKRSGHSPWAFDDAIDFLSKLVNTADNDPLPMAIRIKEIEKECNHDVKAVEIYIAEKLTDAGFGDLCSYIHLGCTSEDVTNIAYACSIKNAINEVLLSSEGRFAGVMAELSRMIEEYADVPMLSLTHGQPATPTTFGKMLSTYYAQLARCRDGIDVIRPSVKFGGATGNLAALVATYPECRWSQIAEDFVNSEYGAFDYNKFCDQIETHDWVARLMNELKILIDVLRALDQDMWQYISRGILGQKVIAKEVGSSTMPNKVNPINFENSEGLAKLSTGMFNSMVDGLLLSRMQRDLSDSVMQRFVGELFGFVLLALDSTLKGLRKIVVNETRMREELDAHPEVLAEAIQTKLRSRGVPNAYNRLKELTRGQMVTLEMLRDFIRSQSDLSDNDKTVLLALRPSNYIGESESIALEVLEKYRPIFY